ncbi:hypothetical protein [Pseudopedobacter sp.]|uniref:hypothetical protein n=1 Tax=Pseudopedobacter sp. TaxID=1936787 RepID=UPI00333FFE20
MIRIPLLLLILFFHTSLVGQEIILDKKASLEQVYQEAYESDGLLPMNELDMEFGYVLYQSEITTETESAALALENVRDYAAVYIDGKLQGILTNSQKEISINTSPGKHQLELYVENIGRITYGPEILDNSKGLFGNISLEGEPVENWKMIPLNIRECVVQDLVFDSSIDTQTPGFYKGTFYIRSQENTYLDTSGWGMGEVWINNKYLGSFWEQEKQKSIQIQSDDLIQGKNEIVVFDLKNYQQKSMRLSATPVFN